MVNSQHDLVSVIIPAYNVQEYIARAIESVVGQTYKNIEIIIINDGSTDRTSVICHEYAKKDNRIKVVDMKNQGVAIARNTGLSIARGNFIAFMDSDDWIEPNTYENVLAAFDENIDIVIFDLIVEDKSNYCAMVDKDNHKVAKIMAGESALDYLYGNGFVWNKVYRKKLIEDMAFEKDIKYEEDWLFNLNAFTKAVSIKVIGNKLYHYFVRNCSATDGIHYRNFISTLYVIEKYYHLDKFNSHKCKQVLRREYYSIIYFALNGAIRRNNKEGYDFYQRNILALRKGTLILIKDSHVPLGLKFRIMLFSLLPYEIIKFVLQVK